MNEQSLIKKTITKNKTYVWTFLGRLVHWLIALSLFTSFISSFYENLLILHISLGFIFFALLILKIIWALIGPKYARWSTYNFDLKALKEYFIKKINNRYRDIPVGHNPASSWFAFLITWLGIISCFLGILLFGIQEGKGIFSFLNEKYFIFMSELNISHTLISYLIILMVFVHISGVLIEQFYHKSNMLMAMISGYKNVKAIDVSSKLSMNLFASIYILFVFAFGIYIYTSKNNIFIESKFKKIDYKKEQKDFYFECSDCHNLFPPHLLPKESWIKLMKEQAKHYDEDLELDKDLVSSIKKYLVENSLENSTREESYYLFNELKNSNNFTITKSNYWKSRHKKIPKEIYKRDSIEVKSNCVSCHKSFEYGILEDKDIHIPKD